MFTRLFWRDAIERVVSTMAQALLAFGTIDYMNVTSVNVKAYLIGVIAAGFYALVKALAAVKTTDGNSASLTVKNIGSK